MQAIETAPCSERALARAAGLSHTLIQGLRARRIAPTPETAKAIADALERMGSDCIEAAGEIRNASEGAP